MRLEKAPFPPAFIRLCNAPRIPIVLVGLAFRVFTLYPDEQKPFRNAKKKRFTTEGRADVAQWQSSGFVNRRLWVRTRRGAFADGYSVPCSA